MKNNKSLLTVSIVFDGKNRFILECLESLYKNYQDLMEVFVVSNLGSKEINDEIKRKFPEVYLIINKTRRGFAENHNYVIEKSKGEYIFILNDDTIILPNAIRNLILYLKKYPDVGLVGPKILNPDFSLQPSTYSFPNFFTIFLKFSGIRKLIPFNKFTFKILPYFYRKTSRFWDHSDIREVETLKGAAMMVRRRTIEEVGLMDEVALAYGEETEWHFRFWKKGWKIVFYPKARIIHYGGQSTKLLSSIPEEEIKSLLNFYKKHKGSFAYFFLRVLIFFLFSLRLVVDAVRFNKELLNSDIKVIKIVLNPDKYFQGKRIFW